MSRSNHGIASDMSGILIARQRQPNYETVKENRMPLVEGKKAKTREGFSENVKAEMNAGKPQKQALAIAYSVARKSGKSHHKPHLQSHHRHKEHR